MGTRNFQNYEAYRRWLAYGHMHREFEKTPGNQQVSIHGVFHPVDHRKR